MAAVAALACDAGPQAGPEVPPTILYGEEMCDRCGMSIDAPTFAAALRLPGGEELHFDDVGELMLALEEGAFDADGAQAWVVASDTGSWVPTESARFVRDVDTVSPMGFGIRAYTSAAAPEGAVRWGEMTVGRP